MGNRHWYCIGKDGIATLCADKDDAEQSAKLASLDWPRNAPYRAVQLVEADELDALQADAAQDEALIRQMKKAMESMHVSCDAFHHSKSDLHEYDELCRPLMRFADAVAAARARLGEGGSK